MKEFTKDIEKATLKNTNYRKVLFTTKNQQLVVMSLKPGEAIPIESHNGTQFFRVEAGTGIAHINKKSIKLKNGASLIVPPNTRHEIVNNSRTNALKLYTIYSPPQHKPDLVQKNKPADDTD